MAAAGARSHTCFKRRRTGGLSGEKEAQDSAAAATNSLYFTERQGIPLSMSEPVAGNHNDLFEIDTSIDELFGVLEKADIPTEGLFVNADAGFDADRFRQTCQKKGVIANVAFNKRNNRQKNQEHLLDEELYKERYAVERTNAWMDSFRSLLNRFDTTLSSWKGFNFLAFIVIGLRKFKQIKKSR